MRRSSKEEYRKVWLFWALNTGNLPKHVWIDLVSMQSRTGCADNRDRLYSILGLVENGREFAVDYEEESADLFWRVGEHFQIWHHSDYRFVRDALRLSENDLRVSLSRKPDLRLTLPIHYAYYQRSWSWRLGRKMDCGHHNCPVPCMPRHEVLLCTPAKDFQVFNHIYSHILLQRDPVSDYGISISIDTSWRKKGWRIEVQDALLQTSTTFPFDTTESPVPEEACSNQRCRKSPLKQNQWVTITQWDQLMETLKKQDSDKLSENWRISLPASYVLTQMKKFH
jgi:hypothetical protein